MIKLQTLASNRNYRKPTAELFRDLRCAGFPLFLFTSDLGPNADEGVEEEYIRCAQTVTAGVTRSGA